MPQITLDIPPRGLNAIAARHGYDQAVHGTKAAFAKQFLIGLAMQEVITYERDTAVKTLVDATETATKTEVIIT